MGGSKPILLFLIHTGKLMYPYLQRMWGLSMSDYRTSLHGEQSKIDQQQKEAASKDF